VTGRRASLLLAALFLASLALRPQLVGVGPLLPLVQSDLDVPHSVAGLLPTILVASMGVFAPLAFAIHRRVGARRAIVGALGAIAVFGVLRAVVPSAPALLALTVPVGIGMAIGNSLMPVAVKDAFADRPTFATAIYATGISGGATVAAAAAVPLASLAWGWQLPLVVFSAATALLLAAWVVLTPGSAADRRPAAPPPPTRWRSGIGWALGGIFGLMSICYYGLNAWLPASYVERGWNEARAGLLLTALNVTTIPVGLVLARLGDRYGSRRRWTGGGAVVMLVAVLGVVLLPGGAFLWAACAGAAIGVLFPSVMAYPLDAARRAGDVGSIAGVMLAVGYTVSALAPFVLGAVRDATGSFTTALWLLVGDATLLLVAAAFLSRERLRRAAASAEATVS
jgi:CP family cyanate transporter-like MFS transporter